MLSLFRTWPGCRVFWLRDGYLRHLLLAVPTALPCGHPSFVKFWFDLHTGLSTPASIVLPGFLQWLLCWDPHLALNCPRSHLLTTPTRPPEYCQVGSWYLLLFPASPFLQMGQFPPWLIGPRRVGTLLSSESPLTRLPLRLRSSSTRVGTGLHSPCLGSTHLLISYDVPLGEPG